MSRINAPRGTADVLPADSHLWQTVENIARQAAERYNFAEIRTPVFEHSELFHRGVGETSDIVHKETYTFDDRGGRSMTLRPEGTAGVVRAVIESNLLADQGTRLKVYYLGPNFRYERPASGRLRIHHQFGAEAFGVVDAFADVECIELQMEFYRLCGIRDLALQINSLGDGESKARYRQLLVDYLAPKSATLSEDSQRRLVENPLRILDSKDPRDIEACQGAPAATLSLSEKSRAHLARVEQLLTNARIPYQVNPNLVRGFDYYTETLWEVTAGGLGAQNAIGGGGRYDNLVERLGGRPTPGVGFGSGIERLLLALQNQNVALSDGRLPLIWLVTLGDAAMAANIALLAELRAAGFRCDLDPMGRSIKSQLRVADREKARLCLITGESELQTQTVVVKDLATGEQQPVARGEIISHLRSVLI